MCFILVVENPDVGLVRAQLAGTCELSGPVRFTSVGAGHTLQQVERQQEEENAPGGDLDPPPIKEREEDHPDDALPGQRRPRTLWFGLGKR